MSDVSVRNLTRRSAELWAGLPFAAVAAEVLPGWELSLAFVGPAKARALNEQLRDKDYIPNVLSYIAGEKSGEIIICPSEAIKQAPSYNLPPTSYYLLLFIHGLLHIKGWAHGATMEKCERDLLAKYEAPRRNGHRHRDLPGQGRRR